MTTQFANASYQEIIDLHTESDRVSIVGIHTPCSDTPIKMLHGFWEQFRKFKYNGCSMTLVPAAQLPADPLQVSYDAGEPTIDPRDMLNPIMFHGCHGDDMGAILNAFYSDPVTGTGQLVDVQSSDSTDHNMAATASGGIPIEDIYEQLYYRALTDKTWLKAHPQRGFKKSGLHPMVYSVASTMQFGPAEQTFGVGIGPRGFVHDDDTGEESSIYPDSLGIATGSYFLHGASLFERPELVIDSNVFYWKAGLSRRGPSFFTPRLQKLGWMDTKHVIVNTLTAPTERIVDGASSDALAQLYLDQNEYQEYTLTPKIFMGMLMLPPAYKTEQHFRLVLNHSFSFCKFRGASMQYPNAGFVKNAYGYFDYSGLSDSKHVDPQPEPKPEPEPEPKDGVDDDVKNIE